MPAVFEMTVFKHITISSSFLDKHYVLYELEKKVLELSVQSGHLISVVTEIYDNIRQLFMFFLFTLEEIKRVSLVLNICSSV